MAKFKKGDSVTVRMAVTNIKGSILLPGEIVEYRHEVAGSHVLVRKNSEIIDTFLVDKHSDLILVQDENKPIVLTLIEFNRLLEFVQFYFDLEETSLEELEDEERYVDGMEALNADKQFIDQLKGKLRNETNA